MPKFRDRCCNLFSLEHHRISKNLRTLPEHQLNRWNLTSGDRVCSACYKRLLQENKLNHETEDAEESSNHDSVGLDVDLDIDNDDDSGKIEDLPVDHSDSDHNTPTDPDCNLNELLSQQGSSLSQLSLHTTLPIINEALSLLNESPIPPKKRENNFYLRSKVDRVTVNLKKALGVSGELETSTVFTDNDAADIITRLKEKYHNENTKQMERIQILSVMPLSWSINKICKVMGATKWTAQTARKLATKHGILCVPSAKVGRGLSNETISLAKQFYEDDNVSSCMPGKKDFLSIRTDTGERVHCQKRLILSNLKELHQYFQSVYPETKIGFSTFASLRPKHCVLAGGSGTHTICVCSMHQNIKLMILGSKLSTLTEDSEFQVVDYGDCIRAIICPAATPQCYFNNCPNCPGISVLHDLLTEVMENNGIDEISCKQWVSTPRTTLVTTIKNAYEFVDDFCEKIHLLLPHSFIAKQQADYLKNCKASLEMDEFVVISDFAENYAFLVQNAASGFHWNNNQATVYTVVAYYRKNEELNHMSLVIISDCLNHDAVAVNLYSELTINWIKSVAATTKKIYFFSDGAPQQYKNFKHFTNLAHYEETHKIKVEWNFFATAHGKGPCDGLGGTVKRMAARASLQLPPDQQITTPEELYKWASKNLPNIAIKFSAQDRYEAMKIDLLPRFNKAEAIPETQKIHCIRPQNNGILEVKRYSSATESKMYKTYEKN